MTDEPMIETSGLRKSYGSHAVLDGVDVSVPRGRIFALLGPNGAGKTTTVNILTTLIRPGGGSARIAGHDVVHDAAKVRGSIGLTGQYAAVDEFQTGEENLVMMCSLAHLGRRAARARTAELLERFDLVEPARKRVATYSGGLRRRLDLAISLIGMPPVVILDEPTTGLDPRSRGALWQTIRELAAAGTSVLLTTQYLEEADQLADAIGVIDDGRMIAAGTPDELKRRVSGEHVTLAFADAATFERARAVPFGASTRFDDESLSVLAPTADPVATIRELLAAADGAGLPIDGVSVVKPTLDDVFLSLTGRPGGTRDAVPTTEEVAA